MHQRSTQEARVPENTHADRWSKDLVGGSVLPTTSGFSLGVAEYHALEFGEPQVHDDQEAVYVIRGLGEMRVDGDRFPVGPGTAVYVPPGAKHALRRTQGEPVKVVYAHGAI